ncbi:MAG: glycosyltransferase [Candidatus Pacearchaeota archaeon]|jgi:cellulose synthase/poly-beta-1,6-N-acetylglucosamine synthase-like glycosyltransferase
MIGLIYSLVILAYIVYIYLLLFIKTKKIYPVNKSPFTVIIPCYNEGYVYFKKCIDSIIKANGDKEIIIVNNNSTDVETLKALGEYRWNSNVKIVFEPRQGKRFAHSKGLDYAKNDIVVFVDSDTIVNKNAFVELIKPFADPEVGAVAGNVRLANRDKNLLTKSISAMFWTSGNIFRKSSSTMGYMQVIAGCLSAYKKDLLLKLEKDYVHQKFMGKPCSISDDRYLTQRIQTRFKKKVEYAEDAICYTFMPETYLKFWKTLERWRRGVIREAILIWKEPIKNAKLLVFDIEFNFIILNIMIVLKLFLLYDLIFNFSIMNLLFTFLWLILMASLYSSYMIIHNPKEFPYKITYSIMYEFFFVFTYFHALWNIRKQSNWVTR